MKTPEEIKKGLLCCSHSDMSCSECPYDGLCNTDSGETPEDDAAALIDHLLTIYSQVSKALCGKENAALEEVLHAASQLKSRLAQAERERDAAIADLKLYAGCKVCKHGDFKFPKECMDCGDETNYWQWRGVCE